MTAWQMQRIIDLCERDGLSPPVTVQPQYNLLDRTIEVEVMPMCLANDIGLLPWSPLGGGWLTSKYRSDQRPQGATRLGEDPNRGVEAYDARNVDSTWRVLATLEEIADDRSASMAQIALAWLFEQPAVAAPIIGVSHLAQLEEALTALEVELDESERARLEEPYRLRQGRGYI